MYFRGESIVEFHVKCIIIDFILLHPNSRNSCGYRSQARYGRAAALSASYEAGSDMPSSSDIVQPSAEGQHDHSASCGEPHGNPGVANILHKVANQMALLTQLLQDVIRMRPPQFDGISDPSGWEGWLFEIEKVFEAEDCAEERKVPLAQYFLTKEVATWWQTVKPHDRATSWEEFHELMEAKYCPWLVKEGRIQAFSEAKP
ncbi:hypothetical protein OROGR_023750 [Orobanche gracilis]